MRGKEHTLRHPQINSRTFYIFLTDIFFSEFLVLILGRKKRSTGEAAVESITTVTIDTKGAGKCGDS